MPRTGTGVEHCRIRHCRCPGVSILATASSQDATRFGPSWSGGSDGLTPPAEITEIPPGEALGQLYNLATDPGEQSDLYASWSAIVRELTDLLAQARSSSGGQ